MRRCEPGRSLGVLEPGISKHGICSEFLCSNGLENSELKYIHVDKRVERVWGFNFSIVVWGWKGEVEGGGA